MINRMVIALAFTFTLRITCSGQDIHPGSEPIPNADVFHASVATAAGYPLEVFLTRPKGTQGKLPVLFEVAWLSCDSVEQPNGAEDGFTQLIWDLASRSGFATYRVNKPGVGKSGGPKCSELDWTAELATYRAAFAAMKNFDFLDTSRIYMIGFSNGGGVAPLVAGDAPVRGYLVFSGWYKTWLEHMLEHERRRMRLSGLAEPEISRRMRQYATFYDRYLNGKLTPAQVITEHPEFKPIWYDETDHQYGRPASSYQQLQDLNLAEAWEKVKAPVLAVHGEYDWVMSTDDYRLLVGTLNSKNPGSAEFVEWPHADHSLYTHANEKKAFGSDPDRKYDPSLTEGAAVVAERSKMRIRDRFKTVIITLGMLGTGVTLLAQENGSTQQARIAIERLHQLDVEATLSGKADALAKLWDSEAVRIGPGGPVEIGRAIYATDKIEEAPTLCYKAEVKDLQIAGDWAFEWGYFSYKQSANTKPGRGKVLRVIKRQPDGSWKFAHVMVFEETNDSAAPMSHPCK